MIKSNNVWAIIPARSGSKSVLDKNIMQLAGYPMIAYSIKAALKCPSIKRVIVTTDSEEYADIAIKYGAEVPFLRPIKISGDNSTDIEFFKHAINWFRNNENFAPEYFVHLRPSTPIRSSVVIEKAINKFINSEFTALRSVHKMSDTSYKTFEIDGGRLKTICSGNFDIESTTLPRQSFPETFNANGYVDIIRTSMIDSGIMHGNNVNAFITETTFEIDEIDDFNYLQFMVNQSPKIIKKLMGSDNE
jgi:CMP-N,N'-diacetyllegionaminic acid synthase